jgi:hypothetical protein
VPIPWVGMTAWWTFCLFYDRAGTEIYCQIVHRSYPHSVLPYPALDRKTGVGTTGTVYTACRSVPLRTGKSTPEHSRLRTHPARRGYTTGTRRNTGSSPGSVTTPGQEYDSRDHHIQEQLPDGSGPVQAIERRGYTCRWPVSWILFRSAPVIKKTSRVFTRSLF